MMFSTIEELTSFIADPFAVIELQRNGQYLIKMASVSSAKKLRFRMMDARYSHIYSGKNLRVRLSA